MKIYLDMDGVITDFDAQLASQGFDGKNWDDDKLWPAVMAIPKFWENMPWMKDGKVLWAFVKSLKPTILTAPARTDPTCKPGKLKWVYRELGRVPVAFARARDKQQYASPDSVLIDDRADNIQQWKAAGGIGIHHTSASKTIAELKKLISVPVMEVGQTCVVEAARPKSPSYNMTIKQLKAIKENNYIGVGGQEYVAEEVDDRIMELEHKHGYDADEEMQRYSHRHEAAGGIEKAKHDAEELIRKS